MEVSEYHITDLDTVDWSYKLKSKEYCKYSQINL